MRKTLSCRLQIYVFDHSFHIIIKCMYTIILLLYVLSIRDTSVVIPVVYVYTGKVLSKTVAWDTTHNMYIQAYGFVVVMIKQMPPTGKVLSRVHKKHG